MLSLFRKLAGNLHFLKNLLVQRCNRQLNVKGPSPTSASKWSKGREVETRKNAVWAAESLHTCTHTRLKNHFSLLKALTADKVGGSRPQSDPAGDMLTKTEARHGFLLILVVFFCPHLCVCVSVLVCVFACILVYATQWGPKYTFHLQSEDVFGKREHVGWSFSFKGLFEGQKLVWG